MVSLESLVAAKLRSDNDSYAGDSQPLLDRSAGQGYTGSTSYFPRTDWISDASHDQRQEGLVQLSEIKVEPLLKDQALGRKVSVARRLTADATTAILKHPIAGDLHIQVSTAADKQSGGGASAAPQDKDALPDELGLEDDNATAAAPAYTQTWFWRLAVPAGFTVLCLAVGIWYAVIWSQQEWLYFGVWRWCIFFAGIGPIYFLAELLVHVLFLCAESHFFTLRYAFYYAVSIKKPGARLLRVALLMILYKLMFGDEEARPDQVVLTYRTTWKVLICMLLFFAADMVKVILAKIVAGHFHNQLHFSKMQDALNKEYYLHALSGARPHGDEGDADVEAQRERPSIWKAPLLSHASLPSTDTLRSVPSVMFNGLRTSLTIPATPSASQAGTPKGNQGQSMSRLRTAVSASALSKAPSRIAADPVSQSGSPRSNAGYQKSEGMRNKQPKMHELMHKLTTELEAESRHDQAATGLHAAGGRELQAKLKELVKHIRENKLRMTFTDALGQAQSQPDGVSNQKEARRLAFYLFWNVRTEYDRDHISIQDLDCFLPPEKAANALSVLDIDGDGKITLSDMRDAVVSIYHERTNLASTLKDTKGAVGKLEIIFALIIHALAGLAYLAIFNVDLSQAWLTFSSIVLAFAFIFGNNIRNMYEAVIFLFVVHPFDVGDVLLMGADQTWCKVEEMALNNIVLQQANGIKVFYPITRMFTEPLYNVTRSSNRWEGFRVLVNISTPAEVFDRVDAAVGAHTSLHLGEFTGKRLVCARDAGDPLKYALCIFYEYCHNAAELGRTSRARHGLFLAISKTLVEAGARYTLPPYEMMHENLMHAPRPYGEGQAYMPSFMTKTALRL